MPPRKELCRNFQRGSCHFGDRCKFVHATSQPSKPNPFGFGVQTGNQFQQTNQEQQMPNPFGFGVQKNTQLGGGNNVGPTTNQYKPFENKWIRSSSSNNTARQPGNQQPATGHICTATDPESCKRIIVEDHQKENPFWKLTCYGHRGNAPCDITGDISCEELRALAYDDAKQGKSVQFIIERERSLLNSKLVEFQNLMQKPYTVHSAAASSTPNPFSAGVTNPPMANSAVPPPASSFSQLNASLNKGSAGAPNYSFGQSSAFTTNTQQSSMFQTNTSPYNTSGAFGTQLPRQSVQSSFLFGTANTSNNATRSANKNPFSTFGNSSQMGNVSDKKFELASIGANSTSAATQLPSSISSDNLPKENGNTDSSIWTKARWNVGEIPEDAPPDIYIH